MTLEEAIIEVYEGSDEQSDLNPYTAGAVDLAKAETIRITRALQRGMNVIGAWKFPNGKRVRFRRFETTEYFTTKVISDTLGAGMTVPGRIVPLPATVDGTGNRFVDWILYVNNIAYHVVASNATTLTVAQEVTTDLSGLAFDLLQRYIMIGNGVDDITLAHNILQITRLTDVNASTDLELVASDRFSTALGNAGQPTQYSYYGGGIMLGSAPTEATTYRLMYYRYPELPATIAGTFEFPDGFHECIVLWAKKWALDRIGELQRGYVAWNLIEKMMDVARTEYDIEQDYAEARAYPKE